MNEVTFSKTDTKVEIHYLIINKSIHLIHG